MFTLFETDEKKAQIVKNATWLLLAVPLSVVIGLRIRDKNRAKLLLAVLL